MPQDGHNGFPKKIRANQRAIEVDAQRRGLRCGGNFQTGGCHRHTGTYLVYSLSNSFAISLSITSAGYPSRTRDQFIDAGAVALGIGYDLIQPQAIERREAGWIRELSWRYLKMAAGSRAQKAA